MFKILHTFIVPPFPFACPKHNSPLIRLDLVNKLQNSQPQAYSTHRLSLHLPLTETDIKTLYIPHPPPPPRAKLMRQHREVSNRLQTRRMSLAAYE
jgi:hypothetical protein